MKIQLQSYIMDDKFVSDMMSEIASAINYWGEVKYNDWDYSKCIEIKPDEDETYTLDEDDIVKGIRLFYENNIEGSSTSQEEAKMLINSQDYDAGMIDQIIQYAMFDEQVYS